MQRIIIIFILSYLFILGLSGCAPGGIDVVSETDEIIFALSEHAVPLGKNISGSQPLSGN